MYTEQVTEYVADDGRRFKDRVKCCEYERELFAVAYIMARLPKTDLRDGEYVQHDKERLLQIKRDLWTLVLAKYGESWPSWRDANAEDVGPWSIVGHVLSDNDYNTRGPIEKAWGRLAVFNFDLGREYDQPYFALHPNEALPKKGD